MTTNLIDKNIKKMNRLRLMADSLGYTVVAFVNEEMQSHAGLKENYFIGSEDSVLVDDLLEARKFHTKEEAEKVSSNYLLKVFPLSFLIQYEINRLAEENKTLRTKK